MPFTREGYVSPDASELCRGEGCTCADAQLELVGCDCELERQREAAPRYVIVDVNKPGFVGWGCQMVRDRIDAEEFDTFEEAKAVAADYGPQFCAVKS